MYAAAFALCVFARLMKLVWSNEFQAFMHLRFEDRLEMTANQNQSYQFFDKNRLVWSKSADCSLLPAWQIAIYVLDRSAGSAECHQNCCTNLVRILVW